jgi:hypothetical protein
MDNGFIQLQRNKYLKLRPLRLTTDRERGQSYEIEMPRTLNSSMTFHEIYFKVENKMLDSKHYRDYLMTGELPKPVKALEWD